jgi:radical SAM protein with 4Fe4S-binding SPASM domain
MSKYSLSSSVVLRSEPQYYGTYAAFDYKKVETEFLTKEEYIILENVHNEPKTVPEISEELEIDSKTCGEFLKRMIKQGYVKEGADSSETVLPEREKISPELFKKFSLPFLSAPTSVDVFITSRCNLKCVHCFANGDTRNSSELSVGDLESIFNQLERMGVFEVRITGGEPLLHREIEKVILSLRQRRFRKVILTNGTLFDEKIVKLLNEIRIIPTISLDDSNAQGCDLFRGVKGAFNQTIAALDLLQRSGVQYGINCCLHRGNLDRYDEIITLAEKYGAQRIAFLHLEPVGRMKNNLKFLPSYEEYETMVPVLLLARSHHRRIDVALDVFLHCYPLKESILEAKKGFISCQTGKSKMSIGSDGFIYPCNTVISDPHWRMGNIRNEKISDIWFSAGWAFFRGDVMIKNLQKCRECSKRAKCMDFYCRLLPYATSGNPFGPHPKCA